MKYSLARGDVLPGCAARFDAGSREQLMEQVATHAAADHGITEFIPEVLSAVDSRIAVSD